MKIKSIVSLMFLAIFSLILFACDNNDVKLDLNKNNITLEVGQSEKLQITVKNEKVSNVVWESSNTAFVTVNQEGLVLAIAEGDAVVKAFIGNTSVECNVNVVANELNDAKIAAKEYLDNVVLELSVNDYDEIDWQDIEDALNSGKVAIEAATNNTDINSAKQNTENAIMGIPTKTQKQFSDAKKNAIADLEDIINGIKTLDEAEFLFAEWYLSSDWQEIIALYDNAINNINEAETIEEINVIVFDIISEIQNFNKISTLEYKMVANQLLDDFLESLNENDYFTTEWDGIHEFILEQQNIIDALIDSEDTLVNIKAVKDEAIRKLIEEAYTKERYILWWIIDYSFDTGIYLVEDLFEDIKNPASKNLDAAVINFMLLSSFLEFEEAEELIIVYNDLLIKYSIETSLILSYFRNMRNDNIINYFVGGIYNELSVVFAPGLWVYAGCGINEVIYIYTQYREIYGANSLAAFNNFVNGIDFTAVQAEENNITMLDSFKNKTLGCINDFWQIPWENSDYELVRTITFDLKGGKLNNSSDNIEVQIRWRDYNVGLEDDEDYRGTYWNIDEYYSGYYFFNIIWNSNPEKKDNQDIDIPFNNWVDSHGHLIALDYNYWDYAMRDGYDWLWNIVAVWDEKTNDTDIIGFWTYTTIGYPITFFLEIYEDGTWKRYSEGGEAYAMTGTLTAGVNNNEYMLWHNGYNSSMGTIWFNTEENTLYITVGSETLKCMLVN